MKNAFLAGFGIAVAYAILRQRVGPITQPGELRKTVDRISPATRRFIDDIIRGS